MKNKNGVSLLLVMLVSVILMASATVFAATVEISTAKTSMQDLDSISGGATPKTALVTPTGSVVVSSGTDSAIWAKSDGWSVTVSSDRTVQSGKGGVNFNTNKDASGDDLAGTLVSGGNISASGATDFIFGVNTGANSSITNQSGATLSGTTSASQGLGIFAGSGSGITNGSGGIISGTATISQGIGIYGSGAITVNNSGAISGTSGNLANGVYTKAGSVITNKSGGSISATSTGSISTSSYGVYISGAGSVSNENGATISATSLTATNGSAYGIRTIGANSTVINTGTVTASGVRTVYGIGMGSTSTVTNAAGATISASGHDYAGGISMANGGTVNNHGTITVTGSNGPTNGVDAINGNVTNTGTITVNGTKLATFGLNMTGTTGAVTNSGNISVVASGIGATPYGVYMSNGSVTNQNGGTISANGAGAGSAYGVHIGTGTITNEAGATITSTGTGVLMAGASTLTNSGDIGGFIGVAATAGNATVNNYGVITGTGGTAISLAGNNNTMIIHEGSTLNGALDASGSGNTLELAGAGSYASDITGTWALTKSGSGTVVLSGDNTYTGATTIDAGALSVDGSILSDVTVNEDGTLMGTGTITGNVTVGSGGTLSPGHSPGALAINGNFLSSGDLWFDIWGLDAGLGQYDMLDITGDATFTGGNIVFDFSGYQPKANDYWDFLFAKSITGWDTLAINFDGLGSGLDWKFESVATNDNRIAERLLITQSGGTPTVPEPATMLLLGLGLAGLAGVRRKFNN